MTKELEIATISAIISNYKFAEIYTYKNNGYIATAELIANWSIEFYEKYKNVDWEDLLETPEKYDFNKTTMCWDDAIMEFVDKKLQNDK